MSSSSYLEIVELESGEVILRRADGEGENLVTISFSEETRVFLDNQTMDVGKAMIGAGLSMVGEMYDMDDNEGTSEHRVIH